MLAQACDTQCGKLQQLRNMARARSWSGTNSALELQARCDDDNGSQAHTALTSDAVAQPPADAAAAPAPGASASAAGCATSANARRLTADARWRSRPLLAHGLRRPLMPQTAAASSLQPMRSCARGCPQLQGHLCLHSEAAAGELALLLCTTHRHAQRSHERDVAK